MRGRIALQSALRGKFTFRDSFQSPHALSGRCDSKERADRSACPNPLTEKRRAQTVSRRL